MNHDNLFLLRDDARAPAAQQRPPVISIVIPCYNAAKYVVTTLESVRAQQGASLEIVVVDDGSTDGSAEIVESTFPEIQLVRSENRGPSAARNLGTSLTHGIYIQYLDADDLLIPGALPRLLETLETSGADIAYGPWQRLEAHDGHYRPGVIVARELRDPEIDLISDFWSPLAAYLFRRDMIDRIGGFNERLRTVQDVRLVVDCALHGARFAYCPDIVAQYRVHTANSQSTRDPVSMVTNIVINALFVEQWWSDHGGLTDAQRQCLIGVLSAVARRAYELDNAAFESAYAALRRLEPGYIPREPRRVRVLSRLIGYRRAERLALWYRRSRTLAGRLSTASDSMRGAAAMSTTIDGPTGAS